MTFTRLHIVPLITEFLQNYPDLKIVLSMDDKVVNIVEGAFDLGIRIGELRDSSLVAKRLADCHSVICASPEYLKQYGTPIEPDDLTHHNCLYYSLFQGGTEWSFYREGKKFKVEPKGNFVVNNSDAILGGLISGLGVGQMPTFIVADYLRSNQLVAVLEKYQLPKHAVYAVYPERKHLPEKVKVFIDFLNAKLGSDDGYWDKKSG